MYEDEACTKQILTDATLAVGPEDKTIYIKYYKTKENGSKFADKAQPDGLNFLTTDDEEGKIAPQFGATNAGSSTLTRKVTTPILSPDGMSAVYPVTLSPKQTAEGIQYKVSSVYGDKEILIPMNLTALATSKLSLADKAAAAALQNLQAGNAPVDVQVKYEGDPAATSDTFDITNGDPMSMNVEKKSYDAQSGLLTLTVTPLAASPGSVDIDVTAQRTSTHFASNTLKIPVAVTSRAVELSVQDAVTLPTTQGNMTISYTGDGELQAEVQSSDPAGVVTVSKSNGTISVLPKTAGTAVVRFWADATDTCDELKPVDVTFTVTDGRANPPQVGDSAYTLQVGESTKTISYDAPLTINNSAPDVVEVVPSNGNKYFTVKGLKEGTATLTLTAEATDRYLPLNQTITFTVGGSNTPAKKSESLGDIVMIAGESKVIDNVSLKDADGNPYAGSIDVASSDAAVATATYDAAAKTITIKGVGAGSATLTISSDSLESDYTVNVSVAAGAGDAPKKNVVKLDEIALTAGQTASATLGLKDADGKALTGTVNVSSSDDTVATARYVAATSKLELKGVAPGTANITLSSDDLADDYVVPVKVSAAPAFVDHPMTDEQKTGLTARVLFDGENVPEGSKTELVSGVVTQGEAFDALKAKFTKDPLGVFEVKLLVDGAEVHEKFGTIELTFPVDAKYNGGTAVVWHRHQDGTVTSEEVEVVDGKAVITVSDLSVFAVEAEAAEADANLTDGDSNKAGAGLSKTGDAAWARAALVLVALGLVCAGGVTWLVRNNRALKDEQESMK